VVPTRRGIGRQASTQREVETTVVGAVLDPNSTDATAEKYVNVVRPDEEKQVEEIWVRAMKTNTIGVC